MSRRTLLKKSLFLLTLACLILSCLSVGGVVYWAQRPQKNQEAIILIKKRTSLNNIISILHKKGVMESPFLCRVYLYMTGEWRHLQAGEYRVPPAWSPRQILLLLKKGQVILHPLTVIEGETSTQFTRKLRADSRFQGPSDIPPEGSLLPETYHYPRGTERKKIIAQSQKAMAKAKDATWAQRSFASPLKSREEMVILASIIEKETALEREKPLIAAVFLNRLSQGMALQADPTVIYALTQGGDPLGRPLTRKDLQVNNPYNTYRQKGLPPTPIANPSLSALQAVVHPAPIPCLYFVADGSGGHVFSTTFKEHQKNHAQWRKIRSQSLP